MKSVKYEQFAEVEIRVGCILSAVEFKEAIKPAYKLNIDFGNDIGELKSSAQLTERYSPEDLVGRQVLGVVNMPSRQIANFMSECLILGVYGDRGVVLLKPDKECQNGDKVG